MAARALGRYEMRGLERSIPPASDRDVSFKWVAALPLMVIALFAGCAYRAEEGATKAFQKEASYMERLLTPAMAGVIERGAARRESERLVQAWKLRVAGSWESYAARTAEALAPAYRCSADAAAMTCLRSLPGDLFQLELASDASRIVRAQLAAIAD